MVGMMKVHVIAKDFSELAHFEAHTETVLHLSYIEVCRPHVPQPCPSSLKSAFHALCCLNCTLRPCIEFISRREEIS